MNTERKNAAPRVAARETAAEHAFQQRFERVPSQLYHADSKTSTDIGPVSALLGRGEKNALTAAELARIMGTSVRDVRAMVEAERKAGAVILGSRRAGGGLFLPAEGEAGKAEIVSFIRSTSRQARSMLFALKSAKAALAVIDGQLGIGGVEVEE